MPSGRKSSGDAQEIDEPPGEILAEPTFAAAVAFLKGGDSIPRWASLQRGPCLD